jgi:hypothetical protein
MSTGSVFLHTKNESQSVIRTWREKRVGAPSLTAERRRQLAGVGTGRGGTKLHASVAGSRVTAFLATTLVVRKIMFPRSWIEETPGWDAFQNRRGAPAAWRESSATCNNALISTAIMSKIGESLSFPKMYYSMPINIFFIVKNHWEPYVTDKPTACLQVSGSPRNWLH